MWKKQFCVFCLTIFVKVQTVELDPGHGLQVVKLLPGENGTSQYKLDLQPLKELLSREDVADYPVAVVSIAGAFRGGKSFLLDFFLRYLNSPRSSQESGKWLGNETEPLRGFHWRGGSQRETTGIHVWSKPFHVKLEATGEEVVVLLMDTQGTFDSESTNRDSTTIFALSTLLSSVQIYNLFRNIQENDLQNLHLFSDYGTNAAADIKVFQELLFLVRDWQNPEEFTYGYSGGNDFLAHKLKVEDDQIPELRVVRQHIHSAFDNVSCFLMPHPGLRVASKKFDGSLSDIEEDFRTSLLELVPSLFDPKHLKPKMVGGQRVTAGEFLVYFEKYVEAFNSEALPPITSITQGASAAAIMAARDAARKVYTSRMDPMDREPLSLTPAAVRARHDAAREAAIQQFRSKKFFGSTEEHEKALNQLLKDMDQFLSSYQYNNGIKLRQSRDAAVGMYHETLRSRCGVQAPQQVCLLPADLQNCHQEVVNAALLKFDSTRKIEANETDDERDKLLTEFTDEYSGLRSFNLKNNEKAVKEACSLYKELMGRCRLGAITAFELQNVHDSAVTKAKSRLAAFRNKPTVQAVDPYEKEILRTIDGYFERTMEEENKIATVKGKNAFNNYVDSEWTSDYTMCYSTSSFTDMFDTAKQVAFLEFYRYSIGPERDAYRHNLSNDMESSRYDLEEKNRRNNRWAANSAYYRYIQLMDSDSSAFNFNIRDDHYSNKVAALRHFMSHRHRLPWSTFCDDNYCSDLENRMDRAFDDNYASFWSRIG